MRYLYSWVKKYRVLIIGIALFSLFCFVISRTKTQTEKETTVSTISTNITENLSSVEQSKQILETQHTPTQTDEYGIVTRVTDGDTIDVNINGTIKRVRYIGVDTPETVDPRKPVQCMGKEASAKNKELVEGKEVRLVKDVSDTDKYGRLLRYVYQGDIFINEALVRNGFARVYTYPPDVTLIPVFLEAQTLAQQENLGLWDLCKDAQTNTSTVNSSVPVSTTQNDACTIKGNISTSGEKIYHLSSCGSYSKTVINESTGEQWFCSEDEALQAGWRKALNC